MSTPDRLKYRLPTDTPIQAHVLTFLGMRFVYDYSPVESSDKGKEG